MECPEGLSKRRTALAEHKGGRDGRSPFPESHTNRKHFLAPSGVEPALNSTVYRRNITYDTPQGNAKNQRSLMEAHQVTGHFMADMPQEAPVDPRGTA